MLSQINKLLRLVITFCLIVLINSKTFSQIQVQLTLNSQNFSFFDKKLSYKLSNRLNRLNEKNDPSPVLKLNIERNCCIRNLSNSFFQILNNLYILKYWNEKFLIYKYENNSIAYPISNIFPQLLNDSLLLTFDGKIINLYTDEIITSTINGSTIPLSILPSAQLTSNGGVIKSDILISEFSKQREFGSLCYNILSHNLITCQYERFSSPDKIEVTDNPFSKYLLIQTEDFNFRLISRYNVEDYIEIPHLFDGSYLDHSNIFYSDSIIYYSVAVGGSHRYSDYNYNQLINHDFNNTNFGEDDIDRMPPLYRTEYREFSLARYFHKKYNKLDIINEPIESNANYYNNYVNLLKVEPYIILEYNIRSNMITAIFDRAVMPLKKVISMHIDKTNNFLIVQDIDTTITIFNLFNKKEIFNLKGLVSAISQENQLIINILGEWTFGAELPHKINFDQLDLNELFRISNDYYIKDISESMSLDELSTKEEFMTKLFSKKQNINDTMVLNRIVDYANMDKKASNYSKYSNEFIRNTYEKQISDYINFIDASTLNPELVFPLRYSSYSQSEKIIYFLTDSIVGEKYQNLIHEIFYNEDFNSNAINEYVSEIRIKNISIEDATILKDSKCAIVIRKYNNSLNIPNYDNLFVFNRSVKLKLTFPEFDLKTFYNTYVPVSSKNENFYNSWFLRYGDFENLIYSKP